MKTALLLALVGLGICVCCIVYCAMMLKRNSLIYGFRVRCIKEDFDVYLASEDYDTMMKQFTKWSYKAFYPDAKGS